MQKSSCLTQACKGGTVNPNPKDSVTTEPSAPSVLTKEQTQLIGHPVAHSHAWDELTEFYDLPSEE